MKKILFISCLFIVISNSSKAQFGFLHFVDSTYNTGSDIAIGDINNDGMNDIIVLRINDDIIGYYLNYGYNNYSPLTIISTSYSSPRSLRIIDSDNDGDLDIFAYRQGSGILRFRNDGNNVFTDLGPISGSNGQPTYFEFNDLDLDGDYDIIAATTFDDEVEWYQNNGNNNFTKFLVSNIENYPKEINAGDLDGDGDIDIVVGYSNTNSKIAWLENLGGNIYSSPVILTTVINTPTGLDVLDLDQDGLNDIVFCSAGDDRLAWFKNTGSAIFLPYQDISTNLNFAVSMDCNDFDGDGDIDIIAGAQYYEISIFENLGNGNFVKSVFLTDEIPILREVRFANILGNTAIDVVGISQLGVFVFQNFKRSYYLKGQAFYDENGNNNKDSTESNFSFCKLVVNNGMTFGYANTYGDFAIGVDTGYYYIEPELPSHWLIGGDSTHYSGTITPINRFRDSLIFPVIPDSIYIDLSIDQITGSQRCNDVTNSWIMLKNEGTLDVITTLDFYLDSSIDFISSNPPPDLINGNHLTWNFNLIEVFDDKYISMQLQLPGVGSIGDTLTNIAHATYLNIQSTLSNITDDTSSFILQCAYDPNEKTVEPKGVHSEGFIDSDEWLTYTIYFQNTGNDTAINILIKDTLSANLDLQTFEIISSSHSMNANVYGRSIDFIFDQIFLPDSNIDEPGSNGFLRYKIKPNNNLVSMEEIKNKCYIFFDYNPPIITNTTLNTICNEFPGTVTVLADSLDLNICKGSSTVLSATSIGLINWYDTTGQLIYSGNNYPVTLNSTTTFVLKESTCFEGQDSILVTVNVDTTLNTIINQVDFTLYAEDTNKLFYQWINCDNNQPISNANNYFYEVYQNGSYAVVVSDGNCIDTSSCISFTTLQVESIPNLLTQVWPNPVTENIYFHLNYPSNMILYNHLGQVLFMGKFLEGNHFLKLDELANGIYILNIVNENSTQQVKIIKE